jgi:integrase
VSKRFTITFDCLADKLIENLKLRGRPRTHRVAICPINHLKKTFSGRKASLVKDFMFWDEHVPRAKKENPKRNLNADRKLFVQILNYGFSLGLMSRPPGRILKPTPPSHIGREIFEDEIQRLFESTKNKNLRLQMKIAFETGMRKGEILSLKLEYCDFIRKIIFLPKEATKTNKGRAIPISSDLADLIKNFPNHGSAYLFPSRFNRTKCIKDNKYEWLEAKLRAKVKCRFHDIRHTAATRKLRDGASIHMVSLVLGMGVGVLTSIYQHLTVEDLREAAVCGGIGKLNL